MANNRENLINKVKAAFSLALNPGATEEERDQALATANRLIAKYQITTSELDKAAEAEAKSLKMVMFTFEVSNGHQLGRFRLDALVWAAVQPLGGSSLHYYRGRSVADGVKLRVFIREDLKEVCEMLLTLLSMQLEDLMEQAVKEHMKDWIKRIYWTPKASEKRQQAISFRRSYIESWGTRVAFRVQTSRREALEEARREAQAEAYAQGVDGEELFNTGKALALVDDSKSARDAQDQWLREQYGANHKVRAARGYKHRSNWSGSAAGRNDGDRTDIGLTQLGGQRTSVTA